MFNLQVHRFQKNLVAYQSLITQSVYNKQLDSGRGTLLHLCDEVIQQEVSIFSFSKLLLWMFIICFVPKFLFSVRRETEASRFLVKFLIKVDINLVSCLIICFKYVIA